MSSAVKFNWRIGIHKFYMEAERVSSVAVETFNGSLQRA